MNSDIQILVIDDSQTTLMLMEWALQDNGYKPLVALSVKEALSLLNSNKPNIILLDLSMPEVSGFDFLKYVKSNKDLENIPILAVSAFDNPETIAEVKGLGAVDFIPKPVNLKLLMEKIKVVLKLV